VRRALASFLEALGVSPERRLEVATAVGEALANAVEHAYPQGDPGVLSIVASIEAPDQLVVVIADAGTFVSRPSRALGRNRYRTRHHRPHAL
jgi:anti-sigma regulatory factor (Ser/Thr protein kinase)